jgi:ABC-type nickel/cobalt efflux system permease component RcnA
MKAIFFTVATIIVLGLTACGSGNSNKQNAHTHEDGSVHGDHATEQAAPSQGTHKHEDGSTHADHTAPNEDDRQNG